mmetsp:Transcript_1985/g.2129  ORF Transcript_1985/g.2129 Transcript_1985/m.2129 type:complete len:763 (+) Transcript_1985:62-2350(+)
MNKMERRRRCLLLLIKMTMMLVSIVEIVIHPDNILYKSDPINRIRRRTLYELVDSVQVHPDLRLSPVISPLSADFKTQEEYDLFHNNGYETRKFSSQNEMIPTLTSLSPRILLRKSGKDGKASPSPSSTLTPDTGNAVRASIKLGEEYGPLMTTIKNKNNHIVDSGASGFWKSKSKSDGIETNSRISSSISTTSVVSEYPKNSSLPLGSLSSTNVTNLNPTYNHKLYGLDNYETYMMYQAEQGTNQSMNSEGDHLKNGFTNGKSIFKLFSSIMLRTAVSEMKTRDNVESFQSIMASFLLQGFNIIDQYNENINEHHFYVRVVNQQLIISKKESIWNGDEKNDAIREGSNTREKYTDDKNTLRNQDENIVDHQNSGVQSPVDSTSIYSLKIDMIVFCALTDEQYSSNEGNNETFSDTSTNDTIPPLLSSLRNKDDEQEILKDISFLQSQQKNLNEYVLDQSDLLVYHLLYSQIPVFSDVRSTEPVLVDAVIIGDRVYPNIAGNGQINVGSKLVGDVVSDVVEGQEEAKETFINALQFDLLLTLIMIVLLLGLCVCVLRLNCVLKERNGFSDEYIFACKQQERLASFSESSLNKRPGVRKISPFSRSDSEENLDELYLGCYRADEDDKVASISNNEPIYQRALFLGSTAQFFSEWANRCRAKGSCASKFDNYRQRSLEEPQVVLKEEHRDTNLEVSSDCGNLSQVPITSVGEYTTQKVKFSSKRCQSYSNAQKNHFSGVEDSLSNQGKICAENQDYGIYLAKMY